MLLYIDPGIGSMIIQVIIGAVAAGSAAMYMFREKVSKFFSRSTDEKATEEEETEKEERNE